MAKGIIVSTQAPPKDEWYIWYNPDTDTYHDLIGGVWIVVEESTAAKIATHAALVDAHHAQAHLHPTLGDVNFTGTVSAGGQRGLTGTRVIDGHTLTFKEGLLVGYQAP